MPKIYVSDDYAALFDNPFDDEDEDPAPDDTIEDDEPDGQSELEQAFEALGLRPSHLDTLNSIN